LGNLIANKEKKLQRYNNTNRIIKHHFGKQITTKFQIHDLTPKAALGYGSKVWTINKRKAQKLEAAQMRFLRPL
jgi:hypothetical protein